MEVNYFIILCWFCHTLTWICHKCTHVPHPEPHSHLPLVPPLWAIPVHQPWAPCIMHQTWTGDSFHMIFYMFQCHSPISSCPCPLPQCPKDCSVHLCLFLLSHIQGYHYHLSKFHKYAFFILYCYFSFWLTSLCIIGSSFIHLIRTDSNVFF